MRIFSACILLACTAFAQVKTQPSAMFHNCPPEGTWKTEEDKQLNTLKNRFAAPVQLTHLDLATVLAPGEDSKRFSNDSGVVIEGYIVDLKFEGPEGCNCGSSADSERDFHVWLGLNPKAAKKQCMVIEVSPRWREAKQWTKDQIHGWKGKHVRVIGWLFWDPRHANMAVNSTPGAKLLARATCWEVHPITDVEVLP